MTWELFYEVLPLIASLIISVLTALYAYNECSIAHKRIDELIGELEEVRKNTPTCTTCYYKSWASEALRRNVK